MGRRDRFRGVFKNFGHPSQAAASESAAKTSGTALEPHLNKPTDRANGAISTGSGDRSHDAPVRDLWALALEKLSSEDIAEMSGIMSGSKLDILQRLRTAALKKQTECENKRWKFELHGRQIVLRDVADKIVVWIDKFKQIGDIAVNFDPVHASLPWAGVRFLLEMSIAECHQMGALLTGIEKTTYLISRCRIYEALYLSIDQSEREEGKTAISNLTLALVNLYATLLNFLSGAIRAYNQNVGSRTLSAILNPAKVADFLENCQALESNAEIEVNNCKRLQDRRVQASLEGQILKLKSLLADLQTPILRIDSRVATLCDSLDSTERRTILEWISGIPYKENHDFACKGRTNDTGGWLLRDERYLEWRASSASMILWLHGNPGAGKTKLVSTVVDDLLKPFESRPNDEAFGYFYCDRNQSDRRDPALILSSFVRQLSTSRDSGAIPRSTLQIYNQKRQAAFASRKLELEESRTVLADLFQIYPQVTLVVDALDECDKETRVGFINILDKLIAESPKPIKILISSRQDRDIRHRFKDGPSLEIRATNNGDDIATFVNHAITTSDQSWQEEISLELRELICKTLVEKSEGMFQWAALQIAALRELYRERDIRNRLGKLPESLKLAYDELYDKIQSQKESAPIIANRAFQWVMCSCWPLSPAELVAAVCQDPETNETDEVDININFVLGVCQNLLVVDQELNLCRFSHLSVQEYFETHHWTSHETDCSVAKVCLSLLISESAVPKEGKQSTEEKGRDTRAHNVLGYARFNWATHLQRLEKNNLVENRLTALLEDFLGSTDQSSLAYQNWHKNVGMYAVTGKYDASPLNEVYHELSPCSRPSLAMVTFGLHKTLINWWTTGVTEINQKNSSDHSLLMLGAIGGWFLIVDDLLKKGADVNASGGKHGSALQAASRSGHESVVQLLIDNGADVNASGGTFGSALQAASYSGHESVVQLLLEKEPDVNASGGEYGSALQAASYRGYESVVQLLLEKEADVNASGGHFGSALQVASVSGHESVVQLLLDNGADVNVSGGRFGGALQAASSWGHESVVQLLLKNGADVNVSGGHFGSALQAASYGGHESVVQLLLKNGADVNVSGGHFGSALQAASYGGHESVVQLLLDNGADVNMSGGEYRSALHAASCRGRKSVVQLLIDNGADVNESGGKYGSPLQAASVSGHESVVQLLLDNGADVNASGESFGSALQAASYGGHELVVQLLLDNGADVNVSGGHFGSALQAASDQGHESVVQLLLKKGADVNMSGGGHGSALQAASYWDHESVVQLLLDNGADVNMSGGEYGSALHAASYRGHESVVQLLLDNGADVNMSGGEYGSALQAASYGGHESVVQLLLKKGADVNVSGGEFGSALRAASYRGHESVVKLLMDKGAIINLSGGEHGSALDIATSNGHDAVVKRLQAAMEPY